MPIVHLCQQMCAAITSFTSWKVNIKELQCHALKIFTNERFFLNMGNSTGSQSNITTTQSIPDPSARNIKMNPKPSSLFLLQIQFHLHRHSNKQKTNEANTVASCTNSVLYSHRNDFSSAKLSSKTMLFCYTSTGGEEHRFLL